MTEESGIFTGMDIKKILDRIDAQLEAQGTTANAVSLKATGSGDTIRNWKRRAKGTANPGVTTTTLGPVAEALNVPLDWLMGNGPDDLAEYRASASKRDQAISIFDRLPASLQDVALKQIAALEPEESQERD
jgi:hypothetical protein